MALHTKTLSSGITGYPGITGYWPSLSGAWRLIRATEFLGKFQQSFRLFGLQAAVYNRLNPRLPVLSSYRCIQPCMDGSFWGTAAEYSTLSRVRLFRSSVSGKKLESVMRFLRCVCLPMRGLEVFILLQELTTTDNSSHGDTTLVSHPDPNSREHTMLRHQGLRCPSCCSVGGLGLATSFACCLGSGFQVWTLRGVTGNYGNCALSTSCGTCCTPHTIWLR